MSERLRWWGKLVVEEPFRVFFPLGILAGVFGVMMWPMYYAGWLGFHPGVPVEAHARMMVEGFMGAVMVGFLGTAFPRLSGNLPLRAGEFAVMLVLWLACAVSLGLGRVAAGDAAFAGLLAATLAVMLSRWVFHNRDTPPPGMVLALAGLAGGGVAAALLSRQSGWWMGAAGVQWAHLWLYQGMLILPLMGVGPYLLPRFFGWPSGHSFDDSPRPPSGWWRRFVISLIGGGALVASFAIEVAGKPSAAYWMRAAVILVWFAWETPVFRRAKQGTTPATAVRWAVGSLVLGCVGAALWPVLRVANLHLLFVSGIGLIVLAVATRVTLGHAGRHDLLGGKIVWLRWVIGLAVVASTTRASAEYWPEIMVSHHIYAAWTWLIVCVWWLIKAGRFLLRSEEAPPDAVRRCPKKRGR